MTNMARATGARVVNDLDNLISKIRLCRSFGRKEDRNR
jgi:hypothetical protein